MARGRGGAGDGQRDRGVRLLEVLAARLAEPSGTDGLLFPAHQGSARVRPTHGFVVLGDGTRHWIENGASLGGWVLDLAGQTRAARARIEEAIPVSPTPGVVPVVRDARVLRAGAFMKLSKQVETASPLIHNRSAGG
jgi:hypothetical protein